LGDGGISPSWLVSAKNPEEGIGSKKKGLRASCYMRRGKRARVTTSSRTTKSTREKKRRKQRPKSGEEAIRSENTSKNEKRFERSGLTQKKRPTRTRESSGIVAVEKIGKRREEWGLT